MKHRGESGFAMLLVFLMAASIAIMLYMQLPRAAFEAQRAKEEMLQERGEQYFARFSSIRREMAQLSAEHGFSGEGQRRPVSAQAIQRSNDRQG